MYCISPNVTYIDISCVSRSVSACVNGDVLVDGQRPALGDRTLCHREMLGELSLCGLNGQVVGLLDIV